MARILSCFQDWEEIVFEDDEPNITDVEEEVDDDVVLYLSNAFLDNLYIIIRHLISLSLM